MQSLLRLPAVGLDPPPSPSLQIIESVTRPLPPCIVEETEAVPLGVEKAGRRFDRDVENPQCLPAVNDEKDFQCWKMQNDNDIYTNEANLFFNPITKWLVFGLHDRISENGVINNH